MNCILNKALLKAIKKGKSVPVIVRFLRIKYRITISEQLVLKRLTQLNYNVKTPSLEMH